MKQIQIHYNVSSYCYCYSIIATLAVAFTSYFYQITFPIAFVEKKKVHKISLAVFSQD